MVDSFKCSVTASLTQVAPMELPGSHALQLPMGWVVKTAAAVACLRSSRSFFWRSAPISHRAHSVGSNRTLFALLGNHRLHQPRPGPVLFKREHFLGEGNSSPPQEAGSLSGSEIASNTLRLLLRKETPVTGSSGLRAWILDTSLLHEGQLALRIWVSASYFINYW